MKTTIGMLGVMRVLIMAQVAIAAPCLVIGPLASASGVESVIPTVREQGKAGDFPLVAGGQAAPVWVDARDFTVARVAAELFAGDVQRVSGVTPALLTNQPPRALQAVLIGTVGHSDLIDRLVAEKKLDVSAIRGQWESSLIATVADPLPEVKSALVIAGSDRRGTAFGVFTLSEAIGVSPWYWWADVTPVKRAQLYVGAGVVRQGPPSVKYRGIFINDEVYGIRPWAVKNFEKERQYMGPRTYAKIFELLLRLKANYCWPAMHVGTGYFNIYPENKRVADDYAIVMGSSHCEPMLFNNIEGGAGEWDVKTDGPWNFLTNRNRIVQAWEKRLKENGRYENSYTLGLRGIHDREMEGGTTVPEKVKILQQAIAAQRALLARYVNPDVTAVPQLFCPYREVLKLYEAGVKVPDDVTLLWTDDNHGYIRHLPTPEEQRRSGRSGIYYHLAFYSYVWLCPISPSLIAYELRKAYDYGADRVWVFNVGDIKPAEKELTFALQMAWDIRRWTPQNADGFIAAWAAASFGADVAPGIAEILREYYRLAARGIPEYIDREWGGNYEPREAAARLAAYRRIGDEAETLAARIPPGLQDAYFQLVLYPVQGVRYVNEKLLLARQSLEWAARGDAAALDYAKRAERCNARVAELTRTYNTSMAGGKWNYMMGWYPREKPRMATPQLVAAGKTNPVVAAATNDVLIAVQARDYSRKQDRADAGTTIFPGLGFSDGVGVWPLTAPSLDAGRMGDAAWVEYDIAMPGGARTVEIRALPTQRIHSGRGLRYAVSLNGGSPRVFDLQADEGQGVWWRNIQQGCVTRSVSYGADQPRQARIRVYLPDPGVVLQDVLVR